MTVFSSVQLNDLVAIKENYDAIVALQAQLELVQDFTQFTFQYNTATGSITHPITDDMVISTLNWGDINEIQQVVRNMIVSRMNAQKAAIKAKLLVYGFDIDSVNTVT